MGGGGAHVTVPPSFPRRGRGGVGCRVGNDVTCSPVPGWEGSSGRPARSKHRQWARVQGGAEPVPRRDSNLLDFWPAGSSFHAATLHKWHNSWRAKVRPSAAAGPLMSPIMSQKHRQKNGRRRSHPHSEHSLHNPNAKR